MVYREVCMFVHITRGHRNRSTYKVGKHTVHVHQCCVNIGAVS